MGKEVSKHLLSINSSYFNKIFKLHNFCDYTFFNKQNTKFKYACIGNHLTLNDKYIHNSKDDVQMSLNIVSSFKNISNNCININHKVLVMTHTNRNPRNTVF